MKQLTTTMIQESINDFLTPEQNEKLKRIFEVYKDLELSRMKTAYATGRFDMLSKTHKTGQDFINDNYETNE